MIQVMLWLPVAVGLVCFVVPRRAVSISAVLGSGIVLGLAIALVASFDTAEAGLQHTLDHGVANDRGSLVRGACRAHRYAERGCGQSRSGRRGQCRARPQSAPP